jgi:hypothetical protein
MFFFLLFALVFSRNKWRTKIPLTLLGIFPGCVIIGRSVVLEMYSILKNRYSFAFWSFF